MQISYPGPARYVTEAAEAMGVPQAADQARRLQPLQRFSGLVGAAVEIARAADPDPESSERPAFSEADLNRLASILDEAAKDVLTLVVAARAAAMIYADYCERLGIAERSPILPQTSSPISQQQEPIIMAGEKQPDVVGRALRPQETHGETPAEPVKSSDPNVTGPAEAAGIPVEAGPGPAAPKAPVPAPGELPPAERKPQEEVERDLINTPQSAREQEAAGDPAKDPTKAPRPTTAVAPLIPPAKAPGYAPPADAEPKLGRDKGKK